MGQYSTAFVSVSVLSDPLRREMASLYLESYDGSSETLFLEDLARKDEVLLVHEDGQLVGFTTVLVYEHEWRQKPVRVVYSGDTVVDRAHWGQQALFVDRNPGFQRGHELVCLCEVEADNMKPLTLKLFSKSLNGC